MMTSELLFIPGNGLDAVERPASIGKDNPDELGPSMPERQRKREFINP